MRVPKFVGKSTHHRPRAGKDLPFLCPAVCEPSQERELAGIWVPMMMRQSIGKSYTSDSSVHQRVCVYIYVYVYAWTLGLPLASRGTRMFSREHCRGPFCYGFSQPVTLVAECNSNHQFLGMRQEFCREDEESSPRKFLEFFEVMARISLALGPGNRRLPVPCSRHRDPSLPPNRHHRGRTSSPAPIFSSDADQGTSRQPDSSSWSTPKHRPPTLGCYDLAPQVLHS